MRVSVRFVVSSRAETAREHAGVRGVHLDDVWRLEVLELAEATNLGEGGGGRAGLSGGARAHRGLQLGWG